jgi:hypothetical protein
MLYDRQWLLTTANVPIVKTPITTAVFANLLEYLQNMKRMMNLCWYSYALPFIPNYTHCWDQFILRLRRVGI